VAQLTQWLTEWSLLYPFSGDRTIQPVLWPAAGNFGAQELQIIFDWKLGNRWKAVAAAQVNTFDAANPGRIELMTGNALTAPNDAAALAALRGLPQVRGAQAVAVGSAILMCLDPNRWTVIDVNANDALVCLRNTIGGQRNNTTNPLYELAVPLWGFTPGANSNGNHPALAVDWPDYMAVCRTIARMTMLSLRTVDRALMQARRWR
jgi:hypothetical protein